jgi:hypothetical protein
LFIDGTYQNSTGYETVSFNKLADKKIYSISNGGVAGTYNLDWMPYTHTCAYIDVSGEAFNATGTYTNPGNIVMPALSGCTTHSKDPHQVKFGEHGAMPGDIVTAETANGTVKLLIVSCDAAGGATYPSAVEPLDRMLAGGGFTEFAKNNWGKTDRTVVKVMQGNISWLNTVEDDGEESATACDIEQSVVISPYCTPRIDAYDTDDVQTNLTSDVVFTDYASGKIYISTENLPDSGWIKVSEISVADTRRTYAIESINALEESVKNIMDNGWVNTGQTISLSNRDPLMLVPCYIDESAGTIQPLSLLWTWNFPQSYFSRKEYPKAFSPPSPSYSYQPCSDDYNKWLNPTLKFDEREETGQLATRANDTDGIISVSGPTVFENEDTVIISWSGGNVAVESIGIVDAEANPVLISFSGVGDTLPAQGTSVTVQKNQPIAKPTIDDLIYKYARISQIRSEVNTVPSSELNTGNVDWYEIDISEFEIAEENITWCLTKGDIKRNVMRYPASGRPDFARGGVEIVSFNVYDASNLFDSIIHPDEIKTLTAVLNQSSSITDQGGQALYYWIKGGGVQMDEHPLNYVDTEMAYRTRSSLFVNDSNRADVINSLVSAGVSPSDLTLDTGDSVYYSTAVVYTDITADYTPYRWYDYIGNSDAPNGVEWGDFDESARLPTIHWTGDDRSPDRILKVKSISPYSQGASLDVTGKGRLDLTEAVKHWLENDIFELDAGDTMAICVASTKDTVDYSGVEPYHHNILPSLGKIHYFDTTVASVKGPQPAGRTFTVNAYGFATCAEGKNDSDFTTDSSDIMLQVSYENLKEIKLHGDDQKCIAMGSLKEPTSPNVTGPEE